MLEFINKNKNIILNSSIFIGINNLNNNTFGQCSGKGNKNQTNINNNSEESKEKDPNQDKKEEEKKEGEEDKKEDKKEDKEFEKVKKELIKKVENLESEYLKFVPVEGRSESLNKFKEKLGSIRKENINQLNKDFNVLEMDLSSIIKIYRKPIDFQNFIETNNIGKFVGSITKELNSNFTIINPIKSEKNDFYNLRNNLNNYLTTNEIHDCVLIEIYKQNRYYYFVVNDVKFDKLSQELKGKYLEILKKNDQYTFLLLIKDCNNNMFFYDSKDKNLDIKQFKETAVSGFTYKDILFINTFFETKGNTDDEKVEDFKDKTKSKLCWISERTIKENDYIIDDQYLLYFFDYQIYKLMKIDDNNKKYIKKLSANLYCVEITTIENKKLINRIGEGDLKIDSFDKDSKELTVSLT